MNTYSRQTWDMIKRCISYGRKNETVWNSIPLIRTRFENLERIEELIAIAVQNQKNSDSGGHIIMKNDAISDLSKRMYRLGCTMTSISIIYKNAVMLQVANVSESELIQLQEGRKFTKFKQMINTARQNLQQLAELGVSNDMLNTLESEIYATEKKPIEVASLNSDMKSATQQIAICTSDARNELEIIDNLFEGVIENDTFINGWFEERRVKGRHNPKKPKDNSTDDNTPKA